MSKLMTCPNCGKRFTPWRGKLYCGEPCRKAAQNRRLGYVRRDGATLVADAPNPENNPEQNQRPPAAVRRYEPSFFWTACNEVTDKLTREGSDIALGFTMLIEGMGWFGRVRDGRGNWSFGPTTRVRAREAVEAWLEHQVERIERREDERMWRGDCARLVGLDRTLTIASAAELAPSLEDAIAR